MLPSTATNAAIGSAGHVGRSPGGGRPLSDSERAFFEPRFGADLGNVRIHTGSAANDAACAVDGRAYTVGTDVVFADGEYAPHTAAGNRLLAHELTHVVQQSRRGTPALQRQAAGPSGSTAGETVRERLRRQGETTVDIYSRFVVQADRNGHSGIEFDILHTGSEIELGDMEMKGEEGDRPADAPPEVTVSEVRATLAAHMTAILIGGEGKYRFVFSRNDEGRMRFLQFRAIDESEDVRVVQEELDDIPDRRQIYKEIFEETERQLKEVGVEIAGFALEQLVMWVVGGVFLRAIGLAGRAAAQGFPRLRQAVQARRTTDIARAVDDLGEEQATELASLMRQVERGRLNANQRRRLGELLGRLEANLGRAILGRTGRQAFGEVSFRGLVQNRPLRELTDQEIRRAFGPTGLKLTNEAVNRLKHPRARNLGMETLNDFARYFNYGVVEDAGRGAVAVVHRRLRIIVDPSTNRIVTIRP